MVVVPTLLSKPGDIDELLEALEIRYLGNRDPNIFFALLTDFCDAPEQSQPEDDALLAHAHAANTALSCGQKQPPQRRLNDRVTNRHASSAAAVSERRHAELRSFVQAAARAEARFV